MLKTQWGYTSHHGDPSAPCELVERILLVPSKWRRMASNRGYTWYKVRRRMARWREREEFDELFAPLSLLRIVATFLI